MNPCSLPFNALKEAKSVKWCKKTLLHNLYCVVWNIWWGGKQSDVALIFTVSYYHCLSQLQEMRQCELGFVMACLKNSCLRFGSCTLWQCYSFHGWSKIHFMISYVSMKFTMTLHLLWFSRWDPLLCNIKTTWNPGCCYSQKHLTQLCPFALHLLLKSVHI